jgi:tetratricopeptide (TPR) repeat protein
MIYLDEHRVNEALPYAQSALALLEHELGPHHPKVADIEDALGVIDREQGRPLQAIAHHRRALSIRKEGGSDRDLATTLTWSGLARLQLGALPAARSDLERAMELRNASEGSLQDWAITAFALARVLPRDAANIERAHGLAQAARQIFVTGGPRYVSEADLASRWLRKQ